MLCPLETCVLCPGDDLILERLGKVAEVVAVACDPDYKVSVLFWMLLGITQGVRAYHIELYMVASPAGSTPARDEPGCLSPPGLLLVWD